MVYYITRMPDDQRRAARGIEALRFDAGSLSLNLVATLARRFGDPVERLGSVERLRAWLAGVGLDVSPSLTDDDVARVRAFREQLDELFRGVLGERPVRPAALAQINAVAACVPQLRPSHDGAALVGPDVDEVLALIAADAMRIVAGAERAHLRVCAADDCRMLYLAHGRRERRWCSSERCGNRSRVAAHRARAAAR
jgi:predicted RNA-binding Zn ribbon-like protein